MPPKMTPVSKAALDDPEVAADPSKTVSTERRYFLQAAPDEDVPPNLHVPAYRFGKDLVPISGAGAHPQGTPHGPLDAPASSSGLPDPTSADLAPRLIVRIVRLLPTQTVTRSNFEWTLSPCSSLGSSHRTSCRAICSPAVLSARTRRARVARSLVRARAATRDGACCALSSAHNVQVRGP